MRLIELTKSVGGDRYLCGGGAGDYQEDDAFQKAGVGLVYQNYLHPAYPQFAREDCVGALSIVGALMNLGFEGVRQLMGGHDG